MFGFRKKNPGINVEFYEQGALKPFARALHPIAQLPDTFEIETTLNLRGEEWHVAYAQPATKEEFRKTGRVQIFLHKPVIGLMPPGDMLFSLPTISDDIASVEESTSLENVFVVHEDDWRQQELVSRDFAEQITKELECIRKIYAEQGVEYGFKELHVRSAIPSPLAGIRLSLTELTAKVGAAHVYRGVAFRQIAAVVCNGYAFRTEQGSIIWGQRNESDEVAVACVRFIDPESTAELAPFESFQSEFNLLLVDWVNCRVVPSIVP